MADDAPGKHLQVRLRVYCGNEIAMGPGKADLLDAIAGAGSISAAARLLGMSYRRAWLLVDAMNRCWDQPLVETVPGGSARSGAAVSPLGRQVLGWYRDLQRQANGVGESGSWHSLAAVLREVPVQRHP
ncbi:MAG TPA: ModE family transcriptional regulator [Novosphingobium sp.]|nr:ModE family transcriptional regulator [Novosphingobium sp.]